MDAERKLKRLCRRHRLPYDEAAELLPLMERALASGREVRRCLEAVVEAAVVTRAAQRGGRGQLEEQVDQKALLALAGLLHGWEPEPS